MMFILASNKKHKTSQAKEIHELEKKMAAESHVLSMKLLIDKRNNKVLFAEASKEVVDFLFNILSLPVGTIVRLLTKQGMVGCLSNLYESIETLSSDYIQPKQNKDTLLKPNVPTQVPLLSLNDEPNVKTYYTCGSGYSHSPTYVTDCSHTVCPGCGGHMTTEMRFVGGAKVQMEGSAGGEGGFVKGVVTYMVMDDLVVQPMSTICGITLLNKFNVTEISSLEDKMVKLDMDKGVEVLKASLMSKSVLTDVFLGSRMV